MYKSEVISIEQGLATLEITISADTLRDAVNAAARKIAARVNIPGFRRGKAPRPILERFVGKDYLYDEALQKVGPDAYYESMKEKGLRPLEDPSFEGLESADLGNGEPLTFTVKVTVRPEVKLGDYKSIKIERQMQEVTDESVERVIANLRDQRAEYVPVDRTSVEQGDLISMDVAGTVDGVPVEAFTASDITVVVGDGHLFEGFEEQLVGAVVGEPKDITVKIPDDYSYEEYRGSDVTFNTTVKTIKVKELPELDDEFAKDLGSESMQDLRDRVRHSMHHRALDQAMSLLGKEALDSLVTTSEVEVPKLLIDREIGLALERLRDRVTEQGLEWEQYLEARGKSEDDIREELSSEAHATAKEKLVASALAEAEKLLPSEEQITMAAAQIISSYGQTSEAALKRAVSDAVVRESTAELLIEQNVIGFLAHTCDANPDTAKCDECASHDHSHAEHGAEDDVIADAIDDAVDDAAADDPADAGGTNEPDTNTEE